MNPPEVPTSLPAGEDAPEAPPKRKRKSSSADRSKQLAAARAARVAQRQEQLSTPMPLFDGTNVDGAPGGPLPDIPPVATATLTEEQDMQIKPRSRRAAPSDDLENASARLPDETDEGEEMFSGL